MHPPIVASSPASQVLFTEYFRLAASRVFPPAADQINADLTSFFRAFLGIGTTTGKAYPTLEEALGVIELALQDAESFRDFPASSSEPRLQQLHDDLIFLITILLEERLRTSGEDVDFTTARFCLSAVIVCRRAVASVGVRFV
jgi:hypothetical protein